jgi:P-type conjugative transfer protein TrbJ
MVFSLMPLVSFAVYPVTDATLIGVTQINGIKSVANQVKSISNQVKSIANEAKSLTNEASMITNQASMIKNQAIMLKGISKDGFHLSDISGNLDKLQSISSSGLAISYASDDISSKFNQQFDNSNDQSNRNYTKHNQTMMQSVLDTSKGTLQTAQQQMNYTKTETTGLKQITSASNSATGLKAVIQGSNQLLDANASELQNIASMQAQQNSLIATKTAADASREQAATKADEQFLAYQSTYKPYQGDDDLKEIPTFN